MSGRRRWLKRATWMSRVDEAADVRDGRMRRATDVKKDVLHI